MRIAGTEYNPIHNAMEIFISGCKSPHCDGCHNSMLWDFDVGDEAYIPEIPDMVEYIWVMGGEPQDQDVNELANWLYALKEVYPHKSIWLWTRYETVRPVILPFLDVVKRGAYDKTRPPVVDKKYNITLASDNQRIVDVQYFSGTTY